MRQRDTLWALWLRALLYMAIIRGGWLVILPFTLSFLEHGRLAVQLRGTLYVGAGLLTFAAGALLALVAGHHLIAQGHGTPSPSIPPNSS